MPRSYKSTRRVEFRDTDAAGIMHFSAFFAYMEEVEHEFLRHVGLSVMTRDGHDAVTWPRVSARCDFKAPLKFEDEVEIELSVAKLGRTSVTYKFHFTHAGRDVAEGEIVAVCCRLEAGKPPEPVPIPQEFAEKLSGPAEK